MIDVRLELSQQIDSLKCEITAMKKDIGKLEAASIVLSNNEASGKLQTLLDLEIREQQKIMNDTAEKMRDLVSQLRKL